MWDRGFVGIGLAYGRSHLTARAMIGKEVVCDEGPLEDRMMTPDGRLNTARALIDSPTSAYVNYR